MKFLILLLIRFYQHLAKSLLLTTGNCRFSPTCSEYCYRVVEKNGMISGTKKCLKRILICGPRINLKTND